MLGRAWGCSTSKRVSGVRQEGLGAEDSMGHIRRSLGLSKGAWT